MTIATFLILSVLISLSSSQSDITISTTDLNNAIDALEESLIGWVVQALTNLSRNFIYMASIPLKLGITSVDIVKTIGQLGLGNGIPDTPVLEIFEDACTTGRLTCNTFTLKVAEGDKSATCLYIEDRTTIPDVVIVAYDSALCWGSDLSTVIGQDSIKVVTPAGGFGKDGTAFVDLGKAEYGLYISGIQQDFLKFVKFEPISV